MTMFPGASATVYRNEDGEPIGWDYPSEPDPGDMQDDWYDDDWYDDYEDDEDCDCFRCTNCGRDYEREIPDDPATVLYCPKCFGRLSSYLPDA